MTSHTPDAKVELVPTQADREAAAALVEWQNGTGWEPPFFHHAMPKGIREGAWDNHPLVQAFAYHALEALEQSDAVMGEGQSEIERLTKLLNTPEVDDFAKGAVLEAAHQRERWGADHDAGKSPFDWFWLVGYLAQKAAASAVAGNNEKALHHTISTAAALANWHLALSGSDTTMRPGIGPQNGGEKAGSAFDLASKLSGSATPIAPVQDDDAELAARLRNFGGWARKSFPSDSKMAFEAADRIERLSRQAGG